MKAGFEFHIRNHSFTPQQILAGSYDPAYFTTAESGSLNFCQAWLNGQKTFDFQTSGSTGHPKKITLSREQMLLSARQTLKALNLEKGFHALLCINPQFIGGKMMLVRSMEGGLKLTQVASIADPLSQFDPSSSFDFIALVPLQLEAIFQNPQSKAILEKAKAIIVGGAPVHFGLQEMIQDIQAPLFSTYGMTETVSHIALRPLNGPLASEYFTAFPEITLSQDGRGCLVIEGAITAGKKLVTNDVVVLKDTHQFHWIGRADNVINSGGIKIQLEKIDGIAESALRKCGISRNLFSWGLPDERLGQQLVLIVEGEPIDEQIAEKWIKLLKLNLVKYEHPKAIFFVKNFHQTPSGKIQKAITVSLVRKN